MCVDDIPCLCLCEDDNASRFCQKYDVQYIETSRSRANTGKNNLDLAECWMQWEPSVAGHVLRSCAFGPKSMVQIFKFCGRAGVERLSFLYHTRLCSRGLL